MSLTKEEGFKSLLNDMVVLMTLSLPLGSKLGAGSRELGLDS